MNTHLIGNSHFDDGQILRYQSGVCPRCNGLLKAEAVFDFI
ncbi:MAG TPA: hypothetical protein PKK23_12420 [Nitrospirales bacterium]|nr:hypothetical protein [Nitrospirales bacterium]